LFWVGELQFPRQIFHVSCPKNSWNKNRYFKNFSNLPGTKPMILQLDDYATVTPWHRSLASPPRFGGRRRPSCCGSIPRPIHKVDRNSLTSE
jgi:hypothetical protein